MKQDTDRMPSSEPMGPVFSIRRPLAALVAYRMARRLARTALVAVGTFSLGLIATPGAADMTTDDIQKGYLEHAALAQLHRWYQVYERPDGGLANALDILADDVEVVSGLGTANGHAEYAARVSQLPDTWNNAHRVRDTTVEVNDDGTTTISAKLQYLNQGMLPDGQVRTADLTYTMALARGDALLPHFTSINIAQNDEGSSDTFTDAYAENRMLSLLHYWLALIEGPERNATPVAEILADDFTLNFSSGVITDFAGFETWLAGPGSAVVASTHIIENFSAALVSEEGAKLPGDGEYTLTTDLDWAGILPDGKEMMAKTRHTWQVSNDVTERFARIMRVDVEVLEPFAPGTQ